jgi:streptogramin lyase
VWTATLGSSAGSWANAIALDSSGNVWLTGTNGTIPAPGEPFVEQLTSPQAVLPYSAQFPVGEAGQDIAIDPSGMVHFAGSIGLISTLAPTQALSPRALSIVSAASAS